MANDALPPAVRQLLARHVRSLEQLEVLLSLRGQPDRSWTVAEVYEVVRSSPASVRQRLEVFTAADFLTKENGPPERYRYAPNNALHSAVEETAFAYEKWRVRVIEAIFAPETDAVQSFADAFKLRKN